MTTHLSSNETKEDSDFDKKRATIEVLESLGWNWRYKTMKQQKRRKESSKLHKKHLLYCPLPGIIGVSMGQMKFLEDLDEVFPGLFQAGLVKVEALAYGNLTDKKERPHRKREKVSHADDTEGTRDCISISKELKTLLYQLGITGANGSRNLSRFDLGRNNIHRAAGRVRSHKTQDRESLVKIFHLAIALEDCLTLVVTYPGEDCFKTPSENLKLVTEVYEPAIERLAHYINGTKFVVDVLETLTVRYT